MHSRFNTNNPANTRSRGNTAKLANTLRRVNTVSRINTLNPFNTPNRAVATPHIGYGVASGVVNTPGQSITRPGPTTVDITAVVTMVALITAAVADTQAVTVVVITTAGAGNGGHVIQLLSA